MDAVECATCQGFEKLLGGNWAMRFCGDCGRMVEYGAGGPPTVLKAFAANWLLAADADD